MLQVDVYEFEGAGAYRLITNSTIERDIVLSSLLRAAGAFDALIGALKSGADEDSAIFVAVAGSGKLFDILGASLIPDGVDPQKWTPEIGAATAAKLKGITAEATKRELTKSITAMVKAFFLAGLHSLATSPKSSEIPAKPMQSRTAASAEISTSASGRSLFASLRATIRRAFAMFFGGRYARR